MAAALSPPPLPESEGHDAPDWVLLDTLGYIARCPNATFAESSTGTGYRVEVSFCTARPPHVSHFCVHIPGVEPSNYLMAPRVISAEANLILFCLSVCPYPCFNPRYRDYFLYRAHPRKPSLDLLPHPYPNTFGDQEVALLSLDDDEYAVAALTSRCDEEDDGTLINETEFDLHLYRSSKAHEGWTSKVVSVSEPLRDSVCPAPVGRGRYHRTTKVITLGSGMVGWVDLWRGILVGNVLQEDPVLHDLPLPLPARGNWRLYRQSRRYLIRDITVSLRKGSIKYVEIEVCPRAAPDHPPESYVEWFRQKRREEHQCGTSCAGWKATAWSLSTSIVPSADWNSECTFHLADITVDPMHSELLPRPPHSISGNPAEATLLRQLIIGFPTLSMDDDVVYVLSKGCPKGLMEVVIAIDMRKKKVQGVAKLVTGKDFTFTRNCTSEVSKYLSKDGGTTAREKLDKQT